VIAIAAVSTALPAAGTAVASRRAVPSLAIVSRGTVAALPAATARPTITIVVTGTVVSTPATGRAVVALPATRRTVIAPGASIPVATRWRTAVPVAIAPVVPAIVVAVVPDRADGDAGVAATGAIAAAVITVARNIDTRGNHRRRFFDVVRVGARNVTDIAVVRIVVTTREWQAGR